VGQDWCRTDPETKLILCGQRWYTPVVGRWTTKDPIGYEGGASLYQYSMANPINYIDSSGQYPQKKKKHHVDGQNCKDMVNRLDAYLKQIYKRIGQYEENILDLPESCPGDDLKPSLSRRGHRNEIKKYQKYYEEKLAEY
jgi:RHS repeat-associated protein